MEGEYENEHKEDLEMVIEAETISGNESGSFSRSLLCLCAVGFLMNSKPSEPFLTKYLLEVKNITQQELDDFVWPAGVFGMLLFTLPVGVLSELWGYRVMVLTGLFFREATRIILIYGEGLPLMMVMQVTYAAATVVDTVYFAYVFLVVDESAFTFATSCIYFSYHSGNILGSLFGQLVYTLSGNLVILFYLSWLFTSVALLMFLTHLPVPRRSCEQVLLKTFLFSGFGAGVEEVKALYKDKTTQLWSYFWVIGYGGFNIWINHIQSAFYILDSQTSFGILETTLEAAFAIGSIIPSITNRRYGYQSLAFSIVNEDDESDTGMQIGETVILNRDSLDQEQERPNEDINASKRFILLTSIISCGSLLSIAAASSIVLVVYPFVCAVALIFALQNTHASAMLASQMTQPRYSLLFALNTTAALVVAFILQSLAAWFGITEFEYFGLVGFMNVVLIVGIFVM